MSQPFRRKVCSREVASERSDVQRWRMVDVRARPDMRPTWRRRADLGGGFGGAEIVEEGLQALCGFGGFGEEGGEGWGVVFVFSWGEGEEAGECGSGRRGEDVGEDLRSAGDQWGEMSGYGLNIPRLIGIEDIAGRLGP